MARRVTYAWGGAVAGTLLTAAPIVVAGPNTPGRPGTLAGGSRSGNAATRALRR